MTDQLEQTEDVRELGLYDDRNPKSLLTLLAHNKELVAHIRSLPHHLLGASERELRKGYRPDDITERLKINFWDEYQLAQKMNRPMVMANVLDRICSKPYFYEKVMNDKLALAWMISPPAEHLHVQKQLYHLGMERMREVLELPLIEKIYKKVGGKNKVERKVNVSLIREVRAITEMMANRIYGAPLQRQQSLNVNLNSEDPNKIKSPEESMTLKELEKELRAVKRLTKELKALPEGETIEGEIEDAETSDEA